MNWNEILDSFQLQPEEIEQVTEKVYKIKANQQYYALKRTPYQEDVFGKWLAIQQYLDQQQIFAFAPIFQSKQKQPFIYDQQAIYYLMPWLERSTQEQPIDEYETVMHTIGRLHGTTMQSHPTQSLKDNKDTITAQFQQELLQYREQSLGYLRQIEAKRFMAPAELQFCMYYRDLLQIYDTLEEWQNYYVTELEKTEQMKYCLCHGNLQPSHYVVANPYTYLLNWEYAYMSSPTYDLTVYYQYLFQFHDCDMNKLKQAFLVYCQYVPLTNFEKSLFVLQILSPARLLHMATEQNNNRLDSLSYSMELERIYRTLLFGFEMQASVYQQLQVME
ncbi:phosphotransferase [Gracilibacillus phocaeensis]|uniref:phosphotransferase n=1 Tax=Gracilibacillus phocaeensis TaxID=2042304 RepID=UPI001031DE48|nr:phosphotransferase [Gracilibacillus phocaeensis]